MWRWGATGAVLLSSLWVSGLLAYQLDAAWLRYPALGTCWALAIAALWSLWRARERHRFAVAYAIFVLCALLGWASLEPRQDRVWADDVAQRLKVVSVDGDTVVLDNVRNFDWRTEDDHDVRWERRSYDLSTLRSADLITSYWMGPAIAHTLVSFGFEDGRNLVFSLEIRKERGEQFSAFGGFFRRFEATLVAADERDIVRVRSNVRGEQVYLYRLHGASQAQLRALFMAYLERARALDAAPAFYNTLTSNCTTIVFELARTIAPRIPLDYRLLLSGYLPEYAHDIGVLAPGADIATLRAKGDITRRAQAADDAADFSRQIRRGVPGIKQDAP